MSGKPEFSAEEERRREVSDELLQEYSLYLIRAQSTSKAEDWVEAGKAFDRFNDALMACSSWSPFKASVPVTF
ncbi:MAG: hypothetical protein WDN46_10235 [Methylocella sp.]